MIKRNSGKWRSEISLGRNRAREIQRHMLIERSSVGLFFTEDVVQAGSQAAGKEKGIKCTSYISHEAPKELSQHKWTSSWHRTLNFYFPNGKKQVILPKSVFSGE